MNPLLEEFDSYLICRRKTFERYLSEAFGNWAWQMCFTDKEAAIVEAAIWHFRRGTFSAKEMAEYLKETGQWKGGRTHHKTIYTYCRWRRPAEHIDFLGDANFRVKCNVPPVPTGIVHPYHAIMTAGDESLTLPCGCLLSREPNDAVTVFYCDEHRTKYSLATPLKLRMASA